MEANYDFNMNFCMLGFYCSQCHYYSTNLENVKSHFRSAHSKSIPLSYILLEDRKEPKFFEEPFYKCDKCVYSTYSHQDMEEHRKSIHNNKYILYNLVESDKNSITSCDICGKKFFNKIMCYLHMNVRKMTEYPLSKTPSTESLIPLGSITKKLQCLNCSKDYTTVIVLNKHIEKCVKKGEMKFMLVLKDETTRYIDHIYENDKLYSCYKCGVEFGRNKLDAICHYIDDCINDTDSVERSVMVQYSEDRFTKKMKVKVKDLIEEEKQLFDEHFQKMIYDILENTK